MTIRLPRKGFQFAKPSDKKNTVHIFTVTEANYKKLCVHSEHYARVTKRTHRLCLHCHKPFEIGDVVISEDRAKPTKYYKRRYFHAACYPLRKKNLSN